MPDQDQPVPKASPRTRRRAKGAKGANGDSVTSAPAAPGNPADGAPEIPESELPPLSFPNSEQYQFRQLADERRRVRIRNEVIFEVILLVVGLAFLVAAHNPAFVVLALIGAAAMVAYEMTIATLE